jgi:AAA+ superfamily predicted ATPase
MQNETIRNLLEALAVSPDNIPLRLHLGRLMIEERMFTEAAQQFQAIMEKSYGHEKAQLGLAECYVALGKYTAASIIYEGLQDRLQPEDQVRFIKCLLKDGAQAHALLLYQQLLALHPGVADEELDKEFRIPNSGSMEMDEEDAFPDDRYFLQKPKEKFSDVGGMQRIKEEISMKIIQPLSNPDLYKAFGKKIGGGILLYGPPGCGKTFIAKATAGEINARFISIGLHDILDMWIGNSEKNLHGIFELARRNAPCVLFFDEVDAMGASRSDLKQSAMRHVINQFLAEMDGVGANNDGILILAATNAPWSVDPASRRPGRFDRIIFVEPPDAKAREEILKGLMAGKPAGEIDFGKIAKTTDNYSGADLKAIIDIATEEKLRESMSKGAIQSIQTKDLAAAAKQHRATTLEWFASARNYALYSNESGLYDDILKYLNIKK